RWPRPVRSSDATATGPWLKELLGHQTPSAGRAIRQVYHVAFRNQRGELVAAADSWCFRTDRDLAREQGTKYAALKARPPRRRSADELAEVDRLYAAEAPRGAVARRGVDVRGGERLPSLAQAAMTDHGFVA